MATYVLVHGGGHGGWCYRSVPRILRSAGHDVHAPTLTGLGDRSHLVTADIDLDVHITDVVNLLRYEDLRDVVLVGHSYGGMVITGVADRAAGRVGHLVYLDAATPVNGQSLADIAGPMMEAARSQARVADGVELVLFPGTEPLPHYGVTDPGDIARMAERLTPHPWKVLRAAPAAHERGGAVGYPPEPDRLHGDVGNPGPGSDGGGPRRRPALGHRHGPRPDDHRAGRRRRAPAEGGGSMRTATPRGLRPRAPSSPGSLACRPNYPPVSRRQGERALVGSIARSTGHELRS